MQKFDGIAISEIGFAERLDPPPSLYFFTLLSASLQLILNYDKSDINSGSLQGQRTDRANPQHDGVADDQPLSPRRSSRDRRTQRIADWLEDVRAAAVAIFAWNKGVAFPRHLTTG